MLAFTDIEPHVQFKTARSGGSRGQHINKVETKVTLLLNPDHIPVLTEIERNRIKDKLRRYMQSNGFLRFSSQESRSQYRNKETTIRKTLDTLNYALREEKPRKKTKRSKASIRARLDAKRRQALKKINRRNNWD